uniref:Uncharacterized protein n=1 Tax=uncultured marine group II/III euryarchaeote AD1000_43_G11 TaxID=1457772 RepID=A0A075FR34_9EURY|nr:hypothetical protein [uncultured marine group II/III euryarchaeote AD1000_43_G11]
MKVSLTRSLCRGSVVLLYKAPPYSTPLGSTFVAHEQPRSTSALLITEWNLSTTSSGVTPSCSAVRVIGVPCSSDPLHISTLRPRALSYLNWISAGRQLPATCPR